MTFHDTVPTDLGGLGPDSTSGQPEQRLAIEFTGSGSEYFRIWIVNLLLTIVTFTLYTPFARARRFAYFYANTRVGGHALGFHGDPWKMLRGYLLVLAMAVAYGLASRFAPVVALVALLAFAVVWPALWRASLQFRLANSSWRGMRFGFDGSLAGAYGALAPMYLPLVLMVGLVALLGAQQEADAGQAPPWWMGLLPLVLMLLAPWGMALIKRYQHGGYRFAHEVARLSPGTGAFYAWAFKTVGVALLFGLAMVAFFALGGALGGGGRGGAGMIGMFVMGMLAYLAMFAVVGPYAVSRLQNLVWGGTSSRRLSFSSDLRLWPFVRLTAKNFLLTALTLGLYRPFAAVATARMRLQAMSVQVRGDADDWVARVSARQGDVAADAAGDFFGIDLGL